MLSHSLPPLPYSCDALEPHIDTLTMELHYDRHHRAYVNNYVQLLEGTGLLEKYSAYELDRHLDEVPEEKKQGVINNLGGHINHSFFWTILSPNWWGRPRGALAQKIDETFGSFENFQSEFTKQALSVFGSGWAWLVQDKGKLLILTHTPKQQSPFFIGLKPILGIDVWEHAYYLKHHNKRADYIAAFWNVVDWKQVEWYFLW